MTVDATSIPVPQQRRTTRTPSATSSRRWRSRAAGHGFGGCWLVLAVAALAFWAWRYWQKRRAQAQLVPVIPPHVRAKQKLRGGAGAHRPAARVLHRSFPTPSAGIWRSGSTSARPSARRRSSSTSCRARTCCTPDQKESLGEFLQRCDLVKFAKYEPGEPELRDLHDSACGWSRKPSRS